MPSQPTAAPEGRKRPTTPGADIATKGDLQLVRSELHTAIAELKSALLMWMISTMVASVALDVTLARIT